MSRVTLLIYRGKNCKESLFGSVGILNNNKLAHKYSILPGVCLKPPMSALPRNFLMLKRFNRKMSLSMSMTRSLCMAARCFMENCKA